MTDSLRDQLLGLGFKPAPKPERKPDRKPEQHAGRKPDRAHAAKPSSQHPPRQPGSKPAHAGKSARPAHTQMPKPPRSREEMDLAKAYAMRAQKEKDERMEAERVKQEEARLRREAKLRVEELVRDKSLNDPNADIARHFPYGGKIKRVHVNSEQLKLLNAGELGVLQQNGRYILVTAALLDEAESIFPACVALKVDPNATAEEDPYADPLYQVPDDLVW